MWHTGILPPEAAPHIFINTSTKCKPVDSQTRQEVKADERKTTQMKQVNEYAKHTQESV